MGCDISVFLEKREGNSWVRADKCVTNGWSSGSSDFLYELLDIPRDYKLFAVLAGVRNRFGIIPISEPRGLPTNLSEELTKLAKKLEGNIFYPSYFSLAELERFEWEGNAIQPSYQSLPVAGADLSDVRYSELADEFLKIVLPRLKDLADSDPTAARLVFWFDQM